MTAFALLNCVTELNAGDWVIQNAANSNVGRFLIALAKLRGIKTINIVRRSGVFDDLKSLGADAVLKEGPDLSQRVRQQVGLDAKIMLGIDSIAGTSCQQIIDCVSDSATVVVYGLLSGSPLRIFAETLFMRDIRLRGFFTHFATRSLKNHEKEKAMRYILGLINKGVLNSKIAGTYSLDKIDAAVHHAGLDGTARDGKVILVPNL